MLGTYYSEYLEDWHLLFIYTEYSEDVCWQLLFSYTDYKEDVLLFSQTEYNEVICLTPIIQNIQRMYDWHLLFMYTEYSEDVCWHLLFSYTEYKEDVCLAPIIQLHRIFRGCMIGTYYSVIQNIRRLYA